LQKITFGDKIFYEVIFLETLYTILIIIAALAIVTLLTAYICFRMTFCARKKDREEYKNTEFPIPHGEIYEAHRENMVAWMRKLASTPHDELEITSFDGLKLRAKFYEYAPGAPIEILLHGYRGSAKRDLNGGLARCFSLGRSALLVDHRASGESEGNVITFGALESRDALAWIDLLIEKYGKDRKIIVTGVSMGAATAMIVAGSENLPKNVVGALADCGYTSAEAIIKKVMREDMHLPPAIFFPFVRLGARLFAHFDIKDASPIEAMKKAKVPVIFFHGDEDRFVPFYMSEENYEACTARKKLVTIHGAGHGLCYPVGIDEYEDALREFYKDVK
jgi:fermentation-respiration switch protein FrsA (DUF1100 family)